MFTLFGLIILVGLVFAIIRGLFNWISLLVAIACFAGFINGGSGVALFVAIIAFLVFIGGQRNNAVREERQRNNPWRW